MRISALPHYIIHSRKVNRQILAGGLAGKLAPENFKQETSKGRHMAALTSSHSRFLLNSANKTHSERSGIRLSNAAFPSALAHPIWVVKSLTEPATENQTRTASNFQL